jgi:hypothetical protein
MNFNAGQVIGAGKDGQPLYPEFGRDADTILIYPVGNGHYDSLQATLQRRFTGGLAITVNYTWSKAINEVNNAGDGPEIQVFDYLYLNRARTGYDRTHNMSVSNVWQLPFGKGKRWAGSGGAASAILGGWQLNSLLSLMTGAPFTVYGSGTGFNTPGSSQTADRNGTSQKLGGIGVGDPFYDTGAFSDPNAARFGTSGFNILSGPGLVNWDFGLFREFSITERFKLQFRAESFNFTNTPHFSGPDDDVTSDTFMQITDLTNLAREGIDERQFRFGLRLSF